jgi:hypothetical protein
LNNRSVEIINKSKVALRNLYAEQGNKEGTWKNYLPSSSRIEPGDSKVVDFGDIGTTGEGSCKRDLYFDFVGGGVSAQGKENLLNIKDVNICSPNKFTLAGGPTTFTISATK